MPAQALEKQSFPWTLPNHPEVTETPSPALLTLIEEMGYEMNREFPEQDLIKKLLSGLFVGMLGIGSIISLLHFHLVSSFNWWSTGHQSLHGTFYS